MAHSLQLTDQQKHSLARQIGGKIGNQTAPGRAGSEELTETFPVWIVDDQPNEAPGAEPKIALRANAQDTGTLHHNIASNVGANAAPGASSPESQSVVASAISRMVGSTGSLKVEALTSSEGTELPRWIRNAAYWVDRHAPGDPFVKLLLIPSKYLHCFWLEYPEKDCVVVIDMPDSFKHLEYQKIYDSDEFFALLGKEPTVRGLGITD